MSRAPHIGPARRREAVVDAALGVFAEGGFAPATMAAIAARAEISKSVLYDCFPGGKGELWAAVLQRVEQDFRAHADHVQAVAETLRGEAAVAAGLRVFVSFAEDRPDAFRLVFGEAGAKDPRVRAAFDEVRDGIVLSVRDAVLERAGLVCDPARGAEWFARMLVAIGEELVRWGLREPELRRDVLIQLSASWLSKGLKVGTAEAVEGFRKRRTAE